MSLRHGRIPPAILLVPALVVALLAVTVWFVPVTTATPAATSGCIGPVAGQHIYDCANVLSPADIAALETDAAAVESAGAPTVVYLQVRDATAQQTLQDAIDLMNRWNVESHAGAHDGFVMFFNVQSGNPQHGQVALYAGQKHYKDGNLPQAELDRIRVDVMTPLLRDGHTAAGIAAGLQMVAHDLRYGPPPPPAYQLVAATIGRIPFNLLGLLFAGLVALLFVRLQRKPPLSSASDEVGGLPALTSQGNLPPGIAGALIHGRVTDAHIEATVLDFACRGLVVLTPEGEKTASLRLMGRSEERQLSGYERETWNGLVRLAGNDQGTISSHELTHLRQDWGDAKSALRRDLIERGWYDPAAAAARRWPLYIAGALGVVGVALGALLVVLSREGWAMIGLSIFLVASAVAFIRAYTVLDTTVEGEIAAAPWRAYRASVTARDYQPNLDSDLPYIVALGLLGKLAPRLKAASERGYAPSWFRASDELETDGHRMPIGGFYPYWIAFHASAAPVSSGSASGGYSGGGAAGGGGGSAGGY